MESTIKVVEATKEVKDLSERASPDLPNTTFT